MKIVCTYSFPFELEDIMKELNNGIDFPKNRMVNIFLYRLKIFIITLLYSIGIVLKDIGLWLISLIQAGITFGVYIGPLMKSAENLWNDIWGLPVRLIIAIFRLLSPSLHKSPKQLAAILAHNSFWESKYIFPDPSRIYQILSPRAFKIPQLTSIKNIEKTWKRARDTAKKFIEGNIKKNFHYCYKCKNEFKGLEIEDTSRVEKFDKAEQKYIKKIMYCPNCKAYFCPDCSIAISSQCPECNIASLEQMRYFLFTISATKLINISFKLAKIETDQINEVVHNMYLYLKATSSFLTKNGAIKETPSPFEIRFIQPIIRLNKKWWLVKGEPGEPDIIVP